MEEQGLGSSEEDDARLGSTPKHENIEAGGTNHVHESSSIPQQQSQNSVIRWERFLPIRSLKVLLVEKDDSTRHVVSALLRNCSYEVTAVANGVQAWKVLENLNNHVDLVLTEVVMPVVSGISLLTKIMNHKTLKNIPVIMMSSHDSMGIVFKCLSKGAVDFLVKPIRKNELKNLWQHVWRRCHSSSGSGSGSESGTQAKKCGRSESAEESGNMSDSSQELDDNASNGLSIRDGSDNVSGTQSSWTKRASHIDSPPHVSPSCQLVDAPDSTCAQVIFTRNETAGNKQMDGNNLLENETAYEDNKPDERRLGNLDVKHKFRHESLSPDHANNRQNIISDIGSNPFENEHLEHTFERKKTNQGPKKCNRDSSCANLNYNSKKHDKCNGPEALRKDTTCCVSGESPSTGVSSDKLRGLGDGCSAVNYDRNILRHSDLSAFSKYNTASSANHGPPMGNVGTSSPLDTSSVAMKTETGYNVAFHLNGPLLNQQSIGSCNNDIASTAKNVVLKTENCNDKDESSSALKSIHSSALQSLQSSRISYPKQVIATKIENSMVNSSTAEGRGFHQHVNGPNHHHHNHHHNNHHLHHRQQHLSGPYHDEKDLPAASQCGSSNMVGGLVEGTGGNYSMNGSGSGSNNGSNGQNGCSPGMITGQIKTEGDNKASVDILGDGNSGKTCGNIADDDRAAQREAALLKFRQKRKERCFEKRVRYQSRKKLAEQRPRVKGQFVRQTLSDNKQGKEMTINDVKSEDNSCDSQR